MSRKSLFRRSLQALTLLVLTGTLVVAQEQRTPFAFERGEELIYGAEFNKGLLRGVDVAEFKFKAASEQIARGNDNVVIVRLSGDVASRGLFTKIAGFKFHQHFESTADVEPFRVLHTDKIEEQGKRKRIIDAEYDHEKRKVIWRERSPNPQGGAFDFTEPIQDILTLIYYLRTQKLEVGKSFEVPVTDNGKVFTLSIAAVEEKEIDSVLGRVNTIRVEPALFGNNAPVQAKGKLSIWVTNDERRLPVRAQLKVDMGTFDIKLRRVTYNDAVRPN